MRGRRKDDRGYLFILKTDPSRGKGMYPEASQSPASIHKTDGVGSVKQAGQNRRDRRKVIRFGKARRKAGSRRWWCQRNTLARDSRTFTSILASGACLFFVRAKIHGNLDAMRSSLFFERSNHPFAEGHLSRAVRKRYRLCIKIV